MFSWLRGRLRSAEDPRLLFLGLDSSGKTTVLYGLKLGEVVTTIPTIGFNVETVEVGGLRLTAWDVGGCDKIRPLWRHYTACTDGVVYMVDSNDRDRMPEAAKELAIFLREEELRGVPVLVLANKQDLPNALPAGEVARRLGLVRPPAAGEQGAGGEDKETEEGEKQQQPGRGGETEAVEWLGARDASVMDREIEVRPACALQMFGVKEGFMWLASAVKRFQAQKAAAASGAPSKPSHASGAPSKPSHSPLAGLMRWSSPAPGTPGNAAPPGPKFPTAEERLSAFLSEPQDPGDTDDAFLAAVEGCKPARWDHFAHLRLAWLYMVRYGRREGKQRLFDVIERYIKEGPPGKAAGGGGGGTFHASMTFFWFHMVHFALASTERQSSMVRSSFRAFLLASPHLADGGLFLQHYSRQRMLLDPAARGAVILPDLKPLPCLLTDVESAKKEQTRNHIRSMVGLGACTSASTAHDPLPPAPPPRPRPPTDEQLLDALIRPRRETRSESGSRESISSRSTDSISRQGSAYGSCRSGSGRSSTGGGSSSDEGAPREWPSVALQGRRRRRWLWPRRGDAVAEAQAAALAGPGGEIGLSGWGSDTVQRVAYAAIKRYGYARAWDLLCAAAVSVEASGDTAKRVEDGADRADPEAEDAVVVARIDLGQRGSDTSADGAEEQEAEEEGGSGVEAASDAGSKRLLGMPATEVAAVLREVAGLMAKHVAGSSQADGDKQQERARASQGGEGEVEGGWVVASGEEGAEVASGRRAQEREERWLESVVGWEAVPVMRSLPQFAEFRGAVVA
ncbi:hypothetical protein HYH03_006460 [Edaphochlamys debaryana]|uniref:ADP-ribosylation factor n=1 Tax=Edaphochlamys debaryana TaxID=47281 RepID=A0A835Y5J4_9CHLO|nr:hypothetical protein HYH03_006460 [Edaphochlamys debaryana]|eukprot:KAG2495517.1 hypothetical protein HYH03_006460 [Edaphochlamys debaryana]